MSKWIVSALILVISGVANAAGHNNLLLLRYPTMSKTQIAFEYGGQIWEMPRAGGQAHVLASGMDLLTKPIFSPDGSMVAFTGTYDHNTDVYVVPADGGQPRRLTFHPGPDVAVGWTPNGKDILFRSHRYSYSDPNQLYTVPVTGGFPKELPLSKAEDGSYSPDGSHLAYVPGFQWEAFWKGYKGGQHTQIWIARLSDSHTIRIPDLDSNENDPMWVGNTVYFLSDRDGPITLFDYDVKNGKVSKLIDNSGFDITSAAAGPGGIVYSQFGQLHLYDFATGQTHAIPVTVAGDLPQRRSHFIDVAKQITDAAISPNGVRAAFVAHGDVFSVPTKHGSIVNLTHSPGAMDRGVAWSPDGESIAYFSDRAGEYDLYIRAQNGTGPARRIALGQNDAYYYELTWSPDSKKVLFADQKDQLWMVNLKARNPKPVKVATNSFSNSFDANWSPDSRWIAYTESLPNYMDAVFVYSLADGKTHQVTDGASDCGSPRFDPNGKYLYFISSTDSGPTHDFDLASFARPVMSHVYAMTLEPGTASPVAPETGFEKTESSTSTNGGKGKSAADKKSKNKQPEKVVIDFSGLQSRAVALPIEPENYVGLTVGKSGELYLQKAPRVIMESDMTPFGVPMSIRLFDLKKKKTQDVIAGVTQFELSANGEKMLYQQGPNWFIADAKPKAKPQPLHIKTCGPSWCRTNSGTRCIATPGASSGPSSTIRFSMASTLMPRRRNSRTTCRVLRAATG